MTRRVGNTVIIEPEESQQCDQCGKIGELRPYGKPAARMICFACGETNEPYTMLRCMHVLYGQPDPDIEGAKDA